MQSYFVFVRVAKGMSMQGTASSQGQHQSSKWSQETGEVIWNQHDKIHQRELQRPTIKEAK